MKNTTVKIFASNIISPYHIAGLHSIIDTFTHPLVEGEVLFSKGHWKNEIYNPHHFKSEFPRLQLSKEPNQLTLSALLQAILALFLRKIKKPEYILIGHSRVNLKLLTHLIAQKKVRWNTPFITAVYDEGIGSYSNFLTRYNAFKKDNSPKILKKIAYITIYPVNQILLRSPLLIDIDWQLLSIKNAKIVENNQAISAYYKYFHIPPTCQNTLFSQTIFFITQPISYMSKQGKESYILLLKQVTSLAEKHNYKLIVKPHPSEQQDTYLEFTNHIISPNKTAEQAIMETLPKFIIGTSSTALINSSLILKKKSYSLSPVLNTTRAIKQTKSIDTLLFDSYVENIYSMQEFEDLLTSSN